MKKVQYPGSATGLWPTKLVPLIDEPPNPSKAFRKCWLILAGWRFAARPRHFMDVWSAGPHV